MAMIVTAWAVVRRGRVAANALTAAGEPFQPRAILSPVVDGGCAGARSTGRPERVTASSTVLLNRWSTACRVAKHYEIEESSSAAQHIRCGASLLTPSGGSRDPSGRVGLGKAMTSNTRVEGRFGLGSRGSRLGRDIVDRIGWQRNADPIACRRQFPCRIDPDVKSLEVSVEAVGKPTRQLQDSTTGSSTTDDSENRIRHGISAIKNKYGYENPRLQRARRGKRRLGAQDLEGLILNGTRCRPAELCG